MNLKFFDLSCECESMNKIKLALAVALSVQPVLRLKFYQFRRPVFPFPQFLPYKNATSTYDNLAAAWVG